MKKIFFLCLFTLTFSSPAFTHDRILTNPQQSYDSLGALELKVSNEHQYVKYVSLGLLRQRAYKRMTRELDKKLLKEAVKKYGADAIANVTYWPGPDTGEPVKFLYGRAEMIRYKKFPQANTAPEIQTLNASQG